MRENLMSGLMGGSWKRDSPAGHLRAPGRCAGKRHHDGLVGTQPAGHLPPRQLPTRFAIGEAASLFDELDGWIRERLRSKVEKRKARGFAHERMPRIYFRRLGLVSLVELRKARLSPA
jgi:hypothetical protein